MSHKKEHLEPKWDRDEFTCFGCEKVNKHVVYYCRNSYIYDGKTYDPRINTLTPLNLIPLKKSKYKVLKEDKYLTYIVQICTNCSEQTIWEIILNLPDVYTSDPHEFICNNMKSQKLIYPNVSSIEDIPNEDLDKNEKSWFNEAKNIVDKSPKAAGALLRAVLESLLRRLFPCEKKEQEEEDKRTIGSILSDTNTKQKLGNEIIKSCEVVKIIGNDATHSGWIINKNEKKNLIEPLFKLINAIAKKLLTYPREENEMLKKMENEINQLDTKETKNGKQQNIKSK